MYGRGILQDGESCCIPLAFGNLGLETPATGLVSNLERPGTLGYDTILVFHGGLVWFGLTWAGHWEGTCHICMASTVHGWGHGPFIGVRVVTGVCTAG